MAIAIALVESNIGLFKPVPSNIGCPNNWLTKYSIQMEIYHTPRPKIYMYWCFMSVAA
jgi:hypothetical protein